MKLFDKNIKSKIKRKNKYQVRWSTDLRYLLSVGFGSTGGAGGDASAASATTRLNVIDPHLVQMMRDVMSPSDTAARLRPCAGAGGGGGGGGASENPGGDLDANGEGGGDGTPVDAPYGAINSGTSGAGGSGGSGQLDNNGLDAFTGSGGGGAGGQGGAIIIITTTAEDDIGTLGTNIYVSAGAGGDAGPAHSSAPGGTVGEDAPGGEDAGKYIPIVV